ncbi:hypothetical protein [uncultured Microbacterium sp.]|uniref:hypothetical protein n=1 Tax=uncultured Microbacterium sp. TaxID=191216 RepID=UPI0025D5D963|nr:hypothetical protein [uncultured Microbacterium sp.]
MNDELTPSERAALRARIVGGAHDITPVGAHRNAWIAGSVAAALVVAIAGGVAVTSTLSAPEIATTPSPSPSVTVVPVPVQTPTPTPTPTPTSSATTPALAFGGDCSVVLDDDAVSAVVGVPMTQWEGLSVWDARSLGGVSCHWRTQDSSGWQSVGVSVLPYSAVPDAVRSKIGVVPVCEGGPCDYSERFGDAWVSAYANSADVAMNAVAAVGARAASSPVTERALPAGAWSVDGCQDQLQRAVERTLGRSGLEPIGTDNVPQGQEWDVLTARGAAAWCSVAPPVYDDRDYFTLRISIAPGLQSDPTEVERFGGTPVQVDGARAAWWIPPANGVRGRLRADADGGIIEAAGTDLSEEQMRTLAANLIGALG